MYPVEHDAGADVLIFSRCKQSQSAAHAESNNPKLLTRGRIQSQQILNRSAQIFFSLIEAECHHELSGFIRRLRGFAVIHVRREGHESFFCKTVANVFDVIHQAPPFLNHDHTWTTAQLWCRQISASVSSVKRKLHHFTHNRSPTLFPPIVFGPATRHPNGSSRQDGCQTDRSHAS